jgi:hypothetical protein
MSKSPRTTPTRSSRSARGGLEKPKADLAQRLRQVRRRVERAQAERDHFESIGLSRLAQERAREMRYWQFVEAVLALRPTMGAGGNKHTVH